MKKFLIGAVAAVGLVAGSAASAVTLSGVSTGAGVTVNGNQITFTWSDSNFDASAFFAVDEDFVIRLVSVEGYGQGQRSAVALFDGNDDRLNNADNQFGDLYSTTVGNGGATVGVGDLLATNGFVSAASGPFELNVFEGNTSPNTATAVFAVEGIEAVPLPGALPLAATGIAMFGIAGWRRRKAS